MTVIFHGRCGEVMIKLGRGGLVAGSAKAWGGYLEVSWVGGRERSYWIEGSV